MRAEVLMMRTRLRTLIRASALILVGLGLASVGRVDAAELLLPALPPEASPQAGVPRGIISEHTLASKVFPSTTRSYWVYTPAGLDPTQAACVMVFHDGRGYVDVHGGWHVPTVLDNLIAKKEIPPMVGVFVDPGVVPAASATSAPRPTRSYEYDGMGDDNVRMVLEEVLPEVEKTVKLSHDASCRGIAGASSGGIAAFTAAWQRPDAFSRVLSSIGTFVNLRGGHDYPTWIRQVEPKPIRVFLEDGSHDLDIYGGGWWFANQAMLQALEFSGYEVNHAWGEGGHDPKHMATVFPDAMRWLWKGFPAAPQAGVAGKGSRQPLVKDILIPGEDWKLVAEGYGFTEGPAVTRDGEVYFTDVFKNRIHKIARDGTITVFAENAKGAGGTMIGPGGHLYAGLGGDKTIVIYDEKAKPRVIASGIESNDIAVSPAGHVYATEPKTKTVWLVPSIGKTPGEQYGPPRAMDTKLSFPNGVRLSIDQSYVYVADTKERLIAIYQIQADGALTNKQPFCHLRTRETSVESGADGMTLDSNGQLYVATAMGVQICDQLGRVNGIIRRPSSEWLANLVLAGPNFDTLYEFGGKQVWKRKVKAKGVLPFAAPLLPPAPHL